jgi:hypothetical protein
MPYAAELVQHEKENKNNFGMVAIFSHEGA